jgi:hypothetical protein
MAANRELLESLRERVRRIETAGRPEGSAVSLGCAALDALLPQRGIARGTIHEWLAAGRRGLDRGGSGAEILSLVAAREVCRGGGALVVIDSAGDFYPPAAALWGICLENAIVVRPAERRDAAWAIDQALRCPAVAAVWGFVDLIDERWLRRFQLSAEQSGSAGLFVRPAAAAGRPTWSESQWLCRGLPRRGLRECSLLEETKSSSPHPSPPEAWGEGTNGAKRTAGAGGAHCALIPSSSRDEHSVLIPSPSWGGPGRGATIPAQTSLARGEDRLIEVRLARLRGGVAGARLVVRIDFQQGTVQPARRDDEAIHLRLSRRLAHPAVSRRAARA